MRFKIDENLPVDVRDLLQAAGYDAHTVHDEALAGQPDQLVAAAAQAEDRILVTLDLDFANILAYPPHAYSGIIVLRPVDQSKAAVLVLLGALLKVLATTPVARRLWIVDSKRIRVRGS